MNKRASTGKQNAFVYGAIRLLLRPLLKIAFNYSTPKNMPELPEGPVLALGAHSSNLDFLFALPLFPKQRFNFVVTSYFFQNVRIGRLLRLFHCIEKEQFRADIAAIRDMRASIKNGASVFIYPEGEVNGTGRCEMPERNVTRLCRMLDVPVYAVRTHGSYFTRPKWGPVLRRGRVEAEVAPVIASREEMAALTDDELYEKICEALTNNDYDWQERARVPFPHTDAAKGLHELLYMCPRCEAEYSMQTEGAEIFCSNCGTRAHMDELGFLHPAGTEDIAPGTVPEWTDMQRAAIARDIDANENWSISTQAVLKFHEDPNTLESTEVGRGTITLDKKEIVYEGTCHDDEVRLAYPLSSFIKLPFTMGNQFDVPNPVRYTSICPLNPQAVMKFVLAVQVLKHMEMK